MGQGKSHVNIKMSYEKKPQQDSDNFTEIVQEIIVSFKECSKSKSCKQ